MFVINFSTTEESEVILKMAYDEFNMLRVSALTLAPNFKSETGVEFSVQLTMYNPFSESLPFKTWDLTENSTENVEEILSDMKDFESKRVRNLQGYPLKISMFEHDMTSKPIFDEDGFIERYTFCD